MACAFDLARLPSAATRFARACSRAASKSCGSIRAMSCPFFTRELKSAWSACTRPETWLPTWTVTSAESVPVAVTLPTMRPRSTAMVSSWGPGSFEPARQRHRP